MHEKPGLLVQLAASATQDGVAVCVYQATHHPRGESAAGLESHAKVGDWNRVVGGKGRRKVRGMGRGVQRRRERAGRDGDRRRGAGRHLPAPVKAWLQSLSNAGLVCTCTTRTRQEDSSQQGTYPPRPPTKSSSKQNEGQNPDTDLQPRSRRAFRWVEGAPEERGRGRGEEGETRKKFCSQWQGLCD